MSVYLPSNYRHFDFTSHTTPHRPTQDFWIFPLNGILKCGKSTARQHGNCHRKVNWVGRWRSQDRIPRRDSCPRFIPLPYTSLRLPPLKEIHRQDIVAFRYPRNPSVMYVKRVIGLGGDVVKIQNKKVYVNGKPL